jgi:hypothetical protein
MDGRRLRLDPFAFALGALSLLTLGFFAARNGAAVIMCSLCFAGLAAARIFGFSNRALVPLAGGLVAILFILWVGDPLPLTSHQLSAFAHASGGVLVGWAVSEYLRGRVGWPTWAIAAMGVVFGLTVLWELGEYVGDRVLNTALETSKTDSALDITFGTFGGAVGTFIATLVPSKLGRG